MVKLFNNNGLHPCSRWWDGKECPIFITLGFIEKNFTKTKALIFF